MYVIAHCYSCGKLLIASEGQKTKRCTYCGAHLQVRKMRVRARVSTAQKATQAIIYLKEKEATEGL